MSTMIPTTPAAQSAHTSHYILTRAQSLQKFIMDGRILDAMNEFYADNVSMRENTKPATAGLEANIEREKAFLATVKSWKGYNVKSIAVGDGVTVIESVMEFVDTRNVAHRVEQVSVQRWDGGKIVEERFYYDSAA